VTADTSDAAPESSWRLDALRWVVDSIPEAFFVTDRSGRYLFFNAAALAHANRPAAELVGRRASDFLAAEWAETVKAADARVMSTGELQRVEMNVPLGDQLHVYETIKVPLRDPTGVVHGVLTLARDITALREAERELANSQRRFETLIEMLPAGVVQVSADRRVMLANREARRILGASDDVIGDTLDAWKDRVVEADGSPCDLLDLPAARCIRERKPQPPRLLGVSRPDTTTWALYSATPLFDGERVDSALVVFPDVAERKLAEDRAEQARVLSEQIFHILADQSTDAIFRTDAAGHCTYVNARGLAQIGMTHAQALGDGWIAGLHPDDRERVAAQWHHTVAHREHWRGYAYRMVDQQGHVTWVESSANPIIGPDGTLHGYIGINKDITELRRAKQRESVMVEELNHRVKNAMATVVGLATATARNSATVAEFMATFAGRIHSMARLHEALARGNWTALSLAQLVDNALGGAVADIHVEGPPVTLSARVAMPLGQALFELHANAVRHGSLAQAEGRLAVRWLLTEGGRVRLHWIETSAAPITVQPQVGVGLTLLRGLIEQEIGGALELRFAVTGLHAQLEVPP
jgi:PAS domain S-box-containing protein